MKTGLMVAALLMLPLSALATPCESDADCPSGQSCQMETMGCPPCIPGGECPSCEPATSGVCADPYEVFAGDCDVDADCPSGWVCEEQLMPCAAPPPSGACACPAGAPGETCEPCDCGTGTSQQPPDETECTPETVQMCTYHPTQCSTDADCQEGFECYEDQICSGGVGCASAGCACAECPPGQSCEPCDCPPPEEDPCADFEPEEPTCETVGAFCAPKQVECATDADCPDGWECADLGYNTATTDCPTCACSSEEPDCTCEPCDFGAPEPVPGACLPQGWSDAIPVAQGGGSYDGATSGEAAPTSPNDILLGNGAPKGGAAGGPGGDNGAGGGGNGNGTGAPGGGTGTTGSTGGSSSTGCSATGTAATTGFAALLSILLIVFVSLARRRNDGPDRG